MLMVLVYNFTGYEGIFSGSALLVCVLRLVALAPKMRRDVICLRDHFE